MENRAKRHRVLLLMDDPQLRRLYIQLLEQRSHQVLSTRDLDEAGRLIRSGELDLAIIDDDVDEDLDDQLLHRWNGADSAPPALLLVTPDSADEAEQIALHPEAPDGVEMVLQKPLSPMEFGIQVDHLLGEAESSTLAEDSEAEREFDTMQREFVYQLDEDLGRVERQWTRMIEHGDNPSLVASRLRRVISPLRTAARHFGFVDLADDFEAFETFVEPFLAPGSQLLDTEIRRGEALVDSLRDSCQSLQTTHPSVTTGPGGDERKQTLLVIDPDTEYLESIEEYGDQFMLRIRIARDLAEARRRVRTPLVTGVLLSTSATDSPSSLEAAVDELREASPLDPLPVALVGDDGEALDRIQSLWAGASVLISKPVTSSKFAKAVRRLASLRRAQQASILVIEPDEDFAEHLAVHLDTRHIAVQYDDAPRSLFESLEDHRPDLLIIDAHIPAVSSFDVCRALRAIPRWQDIPIIMVADDDQPELRLAAYEAGADDFFGRNLAVDELQARVQIRLQRARLLSERIDRDALTGLLSRRAFLERLAARISEVTRHGRSLVFALLDIDHFKVVNDRHGHPTGDRVLQRIGRLLRDRFRIEDLRARWGGEEFAVVLVDEETATARKALDRVRREFGDADFEAPDGTSFQVTFSAGLAEFPTDGYDAESLLATADDRLLRAKKAGRNTIVTGT